MQFLLEQPRTAKLATTRKDGSPHVAAVWIDLDDEGNVYFTTGKQSLKGRSLRRDPRVSFCVDDERPPFSYVVVEGTAETSEDLEELVYWATRIGGRYMGAGRAEEFGQRNGVPGELLVKITPGKVIARQGISD
jgi:PPOX class probable F420-dependent enzyme